MWSLTSQRVRRTSDPENFQSPTKGTFSTESAHIGHRVAINLDLWGRALRRDRSTDRDSFGSLGNTLPGTGEGPTIAAGRLALMELQLGMACYREFPPQRPVIPADLSRNVIQVSDYVPSA